MDRARGRPPIEAVGDDLNAYDPASRSRRAYRRPAAQHLGAAASSTPRGGTGSLLVHCFGVGVELGRHGRQAGSFGLAQLAVAVGVGADEGHFRCRGRRLLTWLGGLSLLRHRGQRQGCTGPNRSARWGSGWVVDARARESSVRGLGGCYRSRPDPPAPAPEKRNARPLPAGRISPQKDVVGIRATLNQRSIGRM